MPDTISTDILRDTYDFPAHTVYVADKPLAADWKAVPALYCNTISLVAGPGVDEATFEYRYGQIQQIGDTRPKQYDPLQLNGKYVKVVIEDSIHANEDDKVPIVWFGRFEFDERDCFGTSRTMSRGRQNLTAYGLLRELERTWIFSAFIDDGDGGTIQIGRGLPFNTDQRGAFNSRSNRSTSEIGGSFVFAEGERGFEDWNAFTAINYLLTYHAPRDSNGDTIVFSYELDNTDGYAESVLSWYDVSPPTDGRTVLEMLGQLIDSRRGLGFRIDYDDEDAVATIYVHTINGKEITLSSGGTIPANPNQKKLDFEQSVDVISATVRNVATTQYDRIIAMGDFKTSTCTLHFSSVEIVKDWNSAEETDYKTAASAQSGYGSLTVDEKAKRNGHWRTADRLQNVYARFKLASDWFQRLISPEGEVINTQFFVAPSIKDDGTPLASIDITTTDDLDLGEPFWTNGARFLRSLTLRDRHNYKDTNIADGTTGGLSNEEQSEFLKPFVLGRSGIRGDDELFEYLERLSLLSEFQDTKRKWACHVYVSDSDPAITLKVSGGPQHFIAKTDSAGLEEDGDAFDAVTNGALDWQDFRATVSLQLDTRVSEEASLRDLPPGIPERILYLQVADARLDYVVPYTVVGLEDGKLSKTTSGGFVRDDRNRLQDIARTAAEWYGKQRQTLSIRYRQVQQLFRIGWLITDIGPAHNLTGINTVVTSIRYDLQNGTTALETSYAEIDFQTAAQRRRPDYRYESG